MTRPTLPGDKHDRAIQALPLDFANGQRLAVSGTSARSTAITTASIVFLKSNQRCYVRVGDSTVTASGPDGKSWPLAADETFPLPITAGQYVAVVQDTVAGFLTIMPALVA